MRCARDGSGLADTVFQAAHGPHARQTVHQEQLFGTDHLLPQAWLSAVVAGVLFGAVAGTALARLLAVGPAMPGLALPPLEPLLRALLG